MKLDGEDAAVIGFRRCLLGLLCAPGVSCMHAERLCMRVVACGHS